MAMFSTTCMYDLGLNNESWRSNWGNTLDDRADEEGGSRERSKKHSHVIGQIDGLARGDTPEIWKPLHRVALMMIH